MFTLFDYSFRPEHIPATEALAWAAAAETICTDEYLLHPDPHPSRQAWCQERCRYTLTRLNTLPPETPLILINHWPLRADLAYLPRIPRFSLWCGTHHTEDWHTYFNVQAVVYGHLHIRGTYWRDGVRCEEVSFGYPKQWNPQVGLRGYLRQILPVPS